jgi:hypothetical protein
MATPDPKAIVEQQKRWLPTGAHWRICSSRPPSTVA